MINILDHLPVTRISFGQTLWYLQPLVIKTKKHQRVHSQFWLSSCVRSVKDFFALMQGLSQDFRTTRPNQPRFQNAHPIAPATIFKYQYKIWLCHMAKFVHEFAGYLQPANSEGKKKEHDTMDVPLCKSKLPRLRTFLTQYKHFY